MTAFHTMLQLTHHTENSIIQYVIAFDCEDALPV